MQKIAYCAKNKITRKGHIPSGSSNHEIQYVYQEMTCGSKINLMIPLEFVAKRGFFGI